ncbi:MAG TPA: 16S rRNA (guanine(966)-N(2))-methyltransferase RsmD [Candidatus Aquicultor sp.]|jgi:16S rRNA (guanine(966)-N(2))-methyltransferase RsmD
MRVIAGSAKGRRLAAPKGMSIRPTADRVKESIFNIVGQEVVDAVVLDVFAGTGNLGIEALSRGADKAYFIDSSDEAIATIKKNLDNTGFIDKAVIMKSQAERAVKQLAAEALTFDLIFLDPPYRISVSFLDAILFNLACQALRPDGLLVLEHDAKGEVRGIEGLVLISTRLYGDTAVSLYRREG